MGWHSFPSAVSINKITLKIAIKARKSGLKHACMEGIRLRHAVLYYFCFPYNLIQPFGLMLFYLGCLYRPISRKYISFLLSSFSPFGLLSNNHNKKKKNKNNLLMYVAGVRDALQSGIKIAAIKTSQYLKAADHQMLKACWI